MILVERTQGKGSKEARDGSETILMRENVAAPSWRRSDKNGTKGLIRDKEV